MAPPFLFLETLHFVLQTFEYLLSIKEFHLP